MALVQIVSVQCSIQAVSLSLGCTGSPVVLHVVSRTRLLIQERVEGLASQHREQHKGPWELGRWLTLWLSANGAILTHSGEKRELAVTNRMARTHPQLLEHEAADSNTSRAKEFKIETCSPAPGQASNLGAWYVSWHWRFPLRTFGGGVWSCLFLKWIFSPHWIHSLHSEEPKVKEQWKDSHVEDALKGLGQLSKKSDTKCLLQWLMMLEKNICPRHLQQASQKKQHYLVWYHAWQGPEPSAFAPVDPPLTSADVCRKHALFFWTI